MKLEITTNYDLFELSDFNRDVTKTRKLEATMKREGWVPAYPLHVRARSNGTYLIVGGHHRFKVAQKLNLPVIYVVCADSLQNYEIEDSTNPWQFGDYLSAYIHLGDVDYVQVQELHNKTGIAIAACSGLLSNEVSGNGNKRSIFKRGEFTVSTADFADSVADVVLALKKHHLPWATTACAVNAVARIIKAGIADKSRLLHKINKFHSRLSIQPNVAAYTKMFDELYNHAEVNKIPLAFLTDEFMKKCNPAQKIKEPAPCS